MGGTEHSDPAMAAPAGSAAGAVRPVWRSAVVAGAVAVALLVAALGVGWFSDQGGGSPATPQVASTAQLRPPADSPGQSASGQAHIQSVAGQRQLSVDATGLPAPDGYYEVWLYDPRSGRMVAMGNLDPAQHGVFPLPPNLDPARYPVVDISAQQYDGDNTHSPVSVLRGQLGS
jgi:anti-sigma-K factor RskA